MYIFVVGFRIGAERRHADRQPDADGIVGAPDVQDHVSEWLRTEWLLVRIQVPPGPAGEEVTEHAKGPIHKRYALLTLIVENSLLNRQLKSSFNIVSRIHFDGKFNRPLSRSNSKCEHSFPLGTHRQIKVPFHWVNAKAKIFFDLYERSVWIAHLH